MLVNKLLSENGYLFVNNVHPEYLRMLIELGSKPIVIQIINDKRVPIVLDLKYHKVNMNCKDYLFQYDPCTITEIKDILSYVSLKIKTGWPLTMIQRIITRKFRIESTC